MQDALKPPSIDIAAALRWQRCAPLQTPWLHEEVARRMAERLEWIKCRPASWLHWDALRGSAAQHRPLMTRYPQALTYAPAPFAAPQDYTGALLKSVQPPWWEARRWLQPSTRVALPAERGVDMLWANMALHLSASPASLVAQWHGLLQTDGFLMFSCLGPDTLIELRRVYERMGWPQPCHAFTDMHDYGDMLVQAGFAEPVMDMERVVLTFASPERLLQELRELGRNLHTDRFPGLRSRSWRRQLVEAMDRHMRNAHGELALTFEVIYGHAIKPPARIKVAQHSAVSLRDMRDMLLRQR